MLLFLFSYRILYFQNTFPDLGMDDLSLPPVFDFGSFPGEKQQAIRLEFVAKDETSQTIVNVVCRTKKKGDDGEDN